MMSMDQMMMFRFSIRFMAISLESLIVKKKKKLKRITHQNLKKMNKKKKRKLTKKSKRKNLLNQKKKLSKNSRLNMLKKNKFNLDLFCPSLFMKLMPVRFKFDRISKNKLNYFKHKLLCLFKIMLV